MSYFSKFFLLIVFLGSVLFSARLPEIDSYKVTKKVNEIMKLHATHKTFTPELMERILNNYLEELDPTKTYFIRPEIQKWLEPSDELKHQILEGFVASNFEEFHEIHSLMEKAIERRKRLEAQIVVENLPKGVKIKEFKEMPWATNEEELFNRLLRIKALQYEAAEKLNDGLKEKSLQRIAKRQARYEAEIQSENSIKQRLILSNVLKAAASALDTHTAYFTPGEAAQFVINVQQRLFGIGAQLRDDVNGFTVVKIVEGGPAAIHKELKVKDRIIAVNGEPVVGMDIADAVDLIRGEENTPVTLTVIRDIKIGEEIKEEKLDITVPRGEVVLKESRYESSYEPFGDGVIAYLRLHSFYQDATSSSAIDLAKEFKNIQKNHKVLGVILDLRSNSGGMLTQAVAVTGLFITKGVVVSIKDEEGSVQHLRDIDGKMIWGGPLIVLVNRGSASASEIVAQTLQDYGRALVIGDDHTYGKGSFQTFTLNTTNDDAVNPEGEYKVTRGRYYTVSGETPQLTGVSSDIIVPGVLTFSEVGEKYAKYPLESDSIPPNYDDNLSDIPLFQRDRIRLLYRYDLQPKLHTYDSYVGKLKSNSDQRIQNNKNYQSFLTEVKKRVESEEFEDSEQFGQNDLQLNESYNIMKDLIILKDSN